MVPRIESNWNQLSDIEKRALLSEQEDIELTYARIEAKRFWDAFANDPHLTDDEQIVMIEAAERAAEAYAGAHAKLIERLESPVGTKAFPAAYVVLNYLGGVEVGAIVMSQILIAFLTKWATTDDRTSLDKFSASQFQNLARDIGQQLFMAARFRESRGDNEGMFKAWSVGFKNWDDKKMNSFGKKYTSINEMTKKDVEDAGAIALDLLVQSEASAEYPCVHYQINTQKNQRGKLESVRYVLPTSVLMVPIINSTSASDIISRMVRNPMLVPPVPHGLNTKGGYVNELFRGNTVKTSGHAHEGLKSTLSQMNVDVINAFQATEWAVNPMVLETMATVYYNNHAQCNMTNSDVFTSPAKEVPPFPTDGTTEEKKEWNAIKSELWDNHYKNQQLRVQMETRLKMASRHASKIFYHQYHYDFRGRVYATCQFLSPQAGDLDRGLLMFATPYKVDTQEAMDAICINLTNLFDGQGPLEGFVGTASDKDTFDERIAWATANEAPLRRLVSDPIEHITMWEDTARFKNTSFQRLAAAEDFIYAIDTGHTRVPVQFDGSCNGYQHWAAMTLDEVSGPEVNLVKRDRPGDLYKKVALGMDDALAGMGTTDPYIKAFKDHYTPDGVPRKATKRVVMCDPYGLKEHSMKTYIITEGHLDWMETYDWRDTPDDFEYFNVRAATKFCGVLKDGLLNVNQRSEEGKQYVIRLTRELSNAGLPLVWKTPSGFTVVNAYKNHANRDLQHTIYLSKADVSNRLRARFTRELPTLKGSKMATTIPPNFVHSLDAAHLQLVSTRLIDAGCNDFSMIHDSFGCPAPYAAVMRNEIRKTFYEIHSQSQLEQLKAQVEEQLGREVESPPLGGTLDITGVLDAEYIFA